MTHWLQAVHTQNSIRRCKKCQEKLHRIIEFDDKLPFIPVIINTTKKLIIEHNIYIHNARYQLYGLIYYGNFHFTSRIIDKYGDIWYNDSMIHQRESIFETNVQNASNEFYYQIDQDKRLSMVIYIKVE